MGVGGTPVDVGVLLGAGELVEVGVGVSEAVGVNVLVGVGVLLGTGELVEVGVGVSEGAEVDVFVGVSVAALLK